MKSHSIECESIHKVIIDMNSVNFQIKINFKTKNFVHIFQIVIYKIYKFLNMHLFARAETTL